MLVQSINMASGIRKVSAQVMYTMIVRIEAIILVLINRFELILN